MCKKIIILTTTFFCCSMLFACGGLRAPESETREEDTGGWETDADMTDTGTTPDPDTSTEDTGTTPDPDTGTEDTGTTPDPDTGTGEEDTGNGNNDDTDNSGQQIAVTVDCGSSECQPHIYHWNPAEQQWDDRFPGGTSLSEFQTQYTFQFHPEEICNVISTYDKQASQSGTVMGFELGVRDVNDVGPAGWYGEENAPSEGNYSVKVNGRNVQTNWSYPSWSEAPLKQVHLRSVCP